MLSGKKRSAWRRFAIFEVVPSRPVLKIEYSTRYGFASGLTDRTSKRMLFSLPIGMRTIEPRSVADALIWLGASKWGAGRRYACIQQQAQVAAVGQDLVDESPSESAQLLLPLWVPHQILLAFAHRDVR